MWTCPACHSALLKMPSNWQCANGHHYDQAKEGYLNLLLSHQKNSKTPGDNKQMINARRSFLTQGHYQPLADELVKLIKLHTNVQSLSLFDAGCGEGYYLEHLRKSLIEQGSKVASSGIDISKIAIQKAAKTYQESSFSVASTFAMPIESLSQDVIFQVFAPSSDTEIFRCLKPQGLWLQINPAEHHLQQVKALIYQKVQDHKVNQQVTPGFELVSNQSLEFDFGLASPQSQLDLLMMTPYYWSASAQTLEKLKLPLEKVTAHFHIKLLRKLERDADE